MKNILFKMALLFMVFGSIHAKVLPKEAKDVANLMRNKTVINCLEKLEQGKDAIFLIGQVSLDSKIETPKNIVTFTLEGSLLQGGDIIIGEATVEFSGPFDPDTNTYNFTCIVK
ncbi:MAG: hypothetical protein ACHQYQ_00650 [Bacteriovoracales bacterium]